MNLFLIAWKLPKEYYQKSLVELKRMKEIFPRLDSETFWHRDSSNGELLTASIHTANRVALPRRYVMQGKNSVIFYSGLPINSTGSYKAHQADALASNWDQLTAYLDGIYCIARAQDNPAQLELITDAIGLEQVYYFHQHGFWLISNSVRLIERICKQTTLDPVGISLFLSTGWVWDDRTLLSPIHVIPGGQFWSWKERDDEPTRTAYFKPSILADLPRKKFTESDYTMLTKELTQSLHIIRQSFDNVKCALTGGRDSRFVASLLIHAGLHVPYYTFGERSGTDAKIAAQIAETFDLNYKFIPIESADVISNWDKMCWQIALKGDGMVPINVISTSLSLLKLQPNHLHIDLGGTGGELATGFYSTPEMSLFLNKYDSGIMQDRMANLVKDPGGIVRWEAIKLAQDCMHNFFIQHLDFGFSPTDIPDIFFLYARLRRKRGSTKHMGMEFQDFFSPFISRAFIKAVFSITAAQRYTESLHYNIMHLVSPELHKIPFDKGPWRPQSSFTYFLDNYKNKVLNKGQNLIKRILNSKSKSPILQNKLHLATDMFDQESWFKAKRENIREVCLDQNNSSIWNFVDRPSFENVTSRKTDPKHLANYGAYITSIFRIATLFFWERTLSDNPALITESKN